MADAQPSVTISAAFPAPPPFYKYFTTENLAQLEEFKASNESAIEDIPPEAPANGHPALHFTSLPAELRYLIPPAPPVDEYRSFNTTFGLRSPRSQLFFELKQAGQLPPSLSLPPPIAPTSLPDPRRLNNLVRRILLQFLSLSRILSTEPVNWVSQWEELRNTFLEAHQVLNVYRPHQARESLIEMMEEQIRKGKEEIETCSEAKEKVKSVLEGLGKASEEAGMDERSESMRLGARREKRSQQATAKTINKRVWMSLEKEMSTVP